MVQYVIRPAKISRKTVWRLSLAMLMSLSLWSPARWWKSVSLNPNTISFCFLLWPRVNRYWQPAVQKQQRAFVINPYPFLPYTAKDLPCVIITRLGRKYFNVFCFVCASLRVVRGFIFCADVQEEATAGSAKPRRKACSVGRAGGRPRAWGTPNKRAENPKRIFRLIACHVYRNIPITLVIGIKFLSEQAAKTIVITRIMR